MSGGKNTTISTSEPRIGALRIQNSAFGLAIPIVYGRNRISGNLLWYGDFTAIPHTSSSSSGGGGKGGGGNVTQENTTYTYQAAVALGLCEGQIQSVGTIWAGKSQYTLNDLGFSLFNGAAGQGSFGYLTTHHPDQAIPYSGTAYVASGAYQLTSNAELPNHSFEVVSSFSFGSGIVDANPKDIVNDLLTNAQYGAGFPAGYIGDLTLYSNYCVASGLFISPALTEQRAAHEYLSEICKLSNAEPIWSEGMLKIIPYGDTAITGNGATYTPNLTPLYDLTDDDFLGDGEDPVICTRSSNADAFNQIQIEFTNRANQYNIEIAEAKDQANIEAFGLRPNQPEKFHGICLSGVAQVVAQHMLQRALYVRNTYEFKLGWKYCLLEPMDIVTISDAALGLNQFQVRIIEIEEDEDGALHVKAEEFPFGVATPAIYSTQSGSGYSVNYNASPGNVNAPVLFEAPDQLTVSGLEVWAAVSGGINWGGCDVWVSNDNATYKKVGTIHGGARHGVLTASLPDTDDPDTTNTLAVDLQVSRGELISGTRTDADQFNTLCYVDGEWLSYETATLTGDHQYDLTYLRRGAYGTAISQHLADTKFARLDQAIFKYPFDPLLIGQTIYLKFTSFNIYGGGQQALADVAAFSYQITGYALNSPLPNITGLATNYISGLLQLYWNPVSDFRPVDYEIRLGPTWSSGAVLGRTPLTKFPAVGDGTYWVAAHYRNDNGVNAYSSLPSGVVIEGATLTQNVVAEFDERATGWLGTVSGGAIKSGNAIQLGGVGNILDVPNALTLLDVLWYGGVNSSGIYTLPAIHEVNVGRIASCQISISYTVTGAKVDENVLTLPDVLVITDWLGAELGVKVNVQPQVDTSNDGVVWSGWQNYLPGVYSAKYFRARAILTSSDPLVTAILSDLIFGVDVPDRIDTGTNIVIPIGGTDINYNAPFNALPNVQITLLNAIANDDSVLTNQTINGFHIEIINGVTNVSRSINWISQGY